MLKTIIKKLGKYTWKIIIGLGRGFTKGESYWTDDFFKCGN